MERLGERVFVLREWTGQGRGSQFRFRGRTAAAILNGRFFVFLALYATDTDFRLAQCVLIVALGYEL